MTDHPVRLVVADDLRRSRLTVFFRLLLAFPHLFWIGIWSIGAFFAALAIWAATLVRGRPPRGLHGFLAGYVRYATHVSAYLFLAANPFPGFLGHRGYPVDVELPEPAAQPRWKTALRLVLALPALALAATLGSAGGGGGSGAIFGTGGVAAVCAVLGWFAALALGRMPHGLRDLVAYSLGYTAQTYAYLLLLTDRYPSADPERTGPSWALPEHPVRIELEDDGRRSRLLVAFRFLLALPHFVWATLWTVVAAVAAIANWLVTLLRGRSPRPLHRFLAAYVRYVTQLGAFLLLVANPFPGFTGARGYPLDTVVAEPRRQKRWITLLRAFLALPALLVSGALGSAGFVAAVLGWFAALVTGRMPAGLRNLAALSLRYSAQTYAYGLVLTDRYPFAGPAVRAAPEDEEDVARGDDASPPPPPSAEQEP